MTIHSAFGLKFGYGQPLSDKKLAKLRDHLSDLKMIIIDEFSLVSSDMLLQIHQRMVQIFQTDESELFAGKSMILVGDLLQLPPVNATPIYNPPKNPKYRAFNEVEQVYQQFEPHELQENHRQGEGNDYANTMNQLRVGNVTEEAIALLESRVTDESFLEHTAMHVMHTNAEVDAHNLEMLDILPTEEIQIPAITVHPDWFGYTVNPDGSIDTTNFLATLMVKVGARVKMLFNVCTIDNLVNGSLGTVVGIETNEKNEVTSIIVAFDDQKAGERQRQKYPFLSEKYADQNGTPIMRQDLEYQLPTKSKRKSTAATGRVIQFPLKLAWAQTAHSMQVNKRLYFAFRSLVFKHMYLLGTNSTNWFKVSLTLEQRVNAWNGLCDVGKM